MHDDDDDDEEEEKRGVSKTTTNLEKCARNQICESLAKENQKEKRGQTDRHDEDHSKK